MINELAIMKLLLDKPEEEFNTNSLAKRLNKDYKNTYQAVQRLEQKNALTLQPFGKAKKIKITTTINPLLYQAEYERTQELLNNKNLALLQETFQQLPPYYTLILFGSHAKKTTNKHSDIDLLFIIPDNEQHLEKEIQKIARTLPLPLHINIFTTKEFKAMKQSKEKTIGTEAITNHIILHGIENYYQL
ncbi:MAG TPA: nucleotidyltransferase domain-containing protein [Candidatus Nanoarchaeia archaeon]|nr:nucleotidyltransferase domain-containing protein [Candidatus Nanoarchaeia archaeon]